jgi:sialate O-acetylesterase
MNLKTLSLSLLTSFSFSLFAEIKPAQIFSDNMVIQRETKAPVWGWADPGEKVSISGSWGETASTIANEHGKWLVQLQTPAAGGPFTITFKGNNSITKKNILSGDVWLCSGQSNMGMIVEKCLDAENEIEKGNHPHIRHIKVKVTPNKQLSEDIEGEWQNCTSENVGSFSATAYFTALGLQKELGVPIGLLNASVGGSLIESWIDDETLKNDYMAQALMTKEDARAINYDAQKAKEKFTQAIAAWKIKSKEAKAKNKPAPRRPAREQDPHTNKNYPGNLYRGMIHPLLPMTVKGVIWYQGESNAFMPERGLHYRTQLKLMINNWRQKWQKPELPFYLVQLPNFKAPQVEALEEKGGWALCRESFTHAATNISKTYVTVNIDLGEENDIHPQNKQGIGQRLASTILNKTYAKSTPTCPLMTQSKIEGDKIIIEFAYTGSGLMAKSGKLESFVIAGKNKKFVWANAVIETRNGKQIIIVSSPKITKPVAVRYAWALNPYKCNLYSKEGMPASPFRTDSWEYGILKE